MAVTSELALQELLDKVRVQMFNRGLVTAGTISRACARADVSGNKQLDKREMDECLRTCGVFLSAQVRCFWFALPVHPYSYLLLPSPCTHRNRPARCERAS